MPLLHKIAGVVVVLAVGLGLWLPGEPGGGRPRDAGRAAGQEAATGRPVKAVDRAAATPATPGATPSPTPVKTLAAATPAAAAAKANELGQVPVLMYHRIVDEPKLPLDRSAKEFRAELVRLAREGYVPITAGELVTGNIDIPAGRHPVVLTFDDSTPEQFALDAQGRPAPDTAVGILLDVARRHPGFRPTATFYLNKDFFQLADREAAGLKWLLRHGFELGNHTLSHKNLADLSKDEVQEEIGEIESKVVALTGTHTATLAYPFGSAPGKEAWAEKKDGVYAFKGIFLAGWRPAPSPYDDDFDRLAVPRVRSEGKIKENDCRKFCSTAWLDRLDKEPATRYTSDGDPRTITFPRSREDRLAEDLRARARVY